MSGVLWTVAVGFRPSPLPAALIAVPDLVRLKAACATETFTSLLLQLPRAGSTLGLDAGRMRPDDSSRTDRLDSSRSSVRPEALRVARISSLNSVPMLNCSSMLSSVNTLC